MGALDEAREAYLDHRRRRRIAAGTIRREVFELARFTRFCRQRRLSHPAHITPAIVEAFAAWLVDAYRTRGVRPGRVLAATSVDGAFSTTRCFLRFLVHEGVLLLDPTRILTRRRHAPELLDRALTLVELKAMLATQDPETPRGLRNRALFEVLFGCGLRAGELVALDADDVDLDGCHVVVRHGKGGRPRIVPLAGAARARLRQYLAHGRPELADSATERAAFLATGGRRLAKGSLNRIVRLAARRALVARPVSPHWFRHGFATALLRGGAGVHVVQRLLGHIHIATTARYTAVGIDDLARVHRRTHPRERRR